MLRKSNPSWTQRDGQALALVVLYCWFHGKTKGWLFFFPLNNFPKSASKLLLFCGENWDRWWWENCKLKRESIPIFLLFFLIRFFFFALQLSSCTWALGDVSNCLSIFSFYRHENCSKRGLLLDLGAAAAAPAGGWLAYRFCFPWLDVKWAFSHRTATAPINAKRSQAMPIGGKLNKKGLLF